MTAKVIVSVDLDDEVTLQLQVELEEGGLFVSCGKWAVPIDQALSEGSKWAEANLAPENLRPAFVTLDFFAEFGKVRGA